MRSEHHVHIHMDDGWTEWLHPRKKTGQFTPKGSGEGGRAQAGPGDVPVRQAKPTKERGLQPSALPVVNLPDQQRDKLRLAAAQLSDHGRAISEGRYEELDIPVSQLASFQEIVETKKVKALAKKMRGGADIDPKDRPRTVKIGNKYVLIDGNHRANAAMLNGDKKLKVFHLGDITNEM